MLFNSVAFLCFFPLVTLAYFLLPLKIRWIWLLVASYYFYMCWEPVYALLMLTSTALTYLSGLALKRFTPDGGESSARQQRLRKLAVAFSFIANLGILAFFKYFSFLADNLRQLAGLAGVSLPAPSFSVLLPVGISFYTFQALSYTVDVYRGQADVERNFFRYALFVSFFPQLVAGPIERSSHLLKQLRRPTRFSYDRMRKGLMLMLWGLFQKVVISDRCAVIVNAVFNEYRQYAGFTIVVAVVLFAVQIYCDFGGYTSIAIGAAEVLGFDICQNFRQPYFAVSVADFWRRWHISLSTWFRDYLYIPLGGSRCSRPRKYLNLMITFLLSGLWHGANWSYVVWGGLNGALQILGDLKNKLLSALGRPPVEKRSLSQRLLSCGGTFLLICCTWVFFRAPTVEDAFLLYKQIFTRFNPWIFVDGTLLSLGVSETMLWCLLLSIGALFTVDLLHERGIRLREGLMRQQLWFRFAVYLLGIFAVSALGVYGVNADASVFIYFQF